MSRRLWPFVLAIACLAFGRPAAAQAVSPDYATPAHVSAVQGTATIERNGQADALMENLPLLEGDRLRTDAGRLEVLLPDGSVLALDQFSTLDLLAGGLVRLSGGRMVFVVARPLEGEARRDYQVHVPAGIVRLLTSGEYRVSVVGAGGAPGADVAVVRGQAVIATDGTSYAVGAGQRVTLTGSQGAVSARAFNAASGDDFYAWADSLRAERVGGRSNAYLPAELQTYGGTFDRDGTWDNVPEYGWVWYPRAAVDWRPYYDGMWAPYGWGWTWVGGGRSVWPTHHYGRWGYGARGWFWIPMAHWGPAWVSWGLATDYVGWCPLGWDDGPVFGLSFGFSIGSRYNSWLGWTVVPSGGFGRGYRVPAYALRGDRLRAVEHASFAVRRSGPTVPGMATFSYGDRSRSTVGAGYRNSVTGSPVNRFQPSTRTVPGAAQPRTYGNQAGAPRSYAAPAASGGRPSSAAPRGQGGGRPSGGPSRGSSGGAHGGSGHGGHGRGR